MGKSRPAVPCLDLIGGLAAIPLLAFVMRPFDFDSRQPLFDAGAGEIDEEQTLGQSLRAEYPGLSRVDLLFATWAWVNTEEVIFRPCKGAIGNQDPTTIRFDEPSIDDGSFHSRGRFLGRKLLGGPIFAPLQSGRRHQRLT